MPNPPYHDILETLQQRARSARELNAVLRAEANFNRDLASATRRRIIETLQLLAVADRSLKGVPEP